MCDPASPVGGAKEKTKKNLTNYFVSQKVKKKTGFKVFGDELDKRCPPLVPRHLTAPPTGPCPTIWEVLAEHYYSLCKTNPEPLN